MQSNKDTSNWLGQHFSSPDRRIGSLGVVLGFVSVIIGIIPLVWPDFRKEFWPFAVYNLILVVSLFSLLVFLILKYVQRGVTIEKQLEQIEQQVAQLEQSRSDLVQASERAKSFLSNQFKHSHDIVHRYKDELFGDRYNPDIKFKLDPEDHALLDKIFRRITFIVRTSFVEYFHSREIDIRDDLAISVKLIFSSEEIVDRFKGLSDGKKHDILSQSNWVVTVFRDLITFETKRNEREVNRTVYGIAENTAFDNLYNKRDNYFFYNNLQGLGAQYHNHNNEWSRYYNATLVVPIRYDGGSNSNNYICFGFLAVDSLNRENLELYNDKECLYILEHAADLVAAFFLSIALGKYKSGPNNSTSSDNSVEATPGQSRA